MLLNNLLIVHEANHAYTKLRWNHTKLTLDHVISLLKDRLLKTTFRPY